MTKDPQESLRAADFIGAEVEAIRAPWAEMALREIAGAQGPEALILHEALPVILADVVAALTASDPPQGAESEDEDSLRFCDASCIDAFGVRAVAEVLREFSILRQVLSAELQARGIGFSVIEAISRLVEVRGLETAVLLMGHLQEKETVELGASAHDIRNQLFVAAGNLFLLKSASPENYQMLLERLKSNVASALHMVETALAPPESS